MADSQIDYASVLADLKARRDRLDATIAGIEEVLGLQATMSASANINASLSSGGDLGPGAFLGMSIVEATVKLLKARRQQHRTEEIVSALKQGGLAFKADSNPANTVGSILNRDFTNGGELVRISRGVWGLAEWHPRLRRRRPQNGVATDDATDPDVINIMTPPEEPIESAEPIVKVEPPEIDGEKKPRPKLTTTDFDDDIPF